MKPHDACILQVEDDENDVYFLHHAFKKAGITNPVRVVSDGEQAIEYLKGAEPFADRAEYPLPSLMLLDLKLPRMSGLEVLKWLRGQPAFRTMVVIVFSSSCNPEDVERSYGLGANGFVVKPLDLEQRLEFAKVLKTWWLDFNRFPRGAAPAAAPGLQGARANTGVCRALKGAIRPRLQSSAALMIPVQWSDEAAFQMELK